MTAIATGRKSPRIYQAYLSELVESTVVLPDVVLAQVRDGVGIVHTFERPLRGLEVGVEIAKEAHQGGVEDVLDDITHQVFESLQQVFKCDERTLGLNVGVSENMSIRQEDDQQSYQISHAN